MYMFTVVRRWGVFYCFVDMWIALLYVIRITATLVLELLLWCDVFLKIIFHICINKNANTIICIPSRNGKQVQQERKNNSHCTKLIHDPFQMGGGGEWNRQLILFFASSEEESHVYLKHQNLLFSSACYSISSYMNIVLKDFTRASIYIFLNMFIFSLS